MRIMVVVFLVGCGSRVGEGDGILDASEVPQVGWTAELQGSAHDVSGTAVIVDENTIEIQDFVYDGGGLNARVFLLIDGSKFNRDVELTDNLVGTTFDGETFVLDLPAEASFDAFNLISIWCLPAAVSFGEGVFSPPL